jgi:CcmD family protein
MKPGKALVCAVAVLVVVVGLTWTELAVAEVSAGQPAQDEFVPLDSVPLEDQLPAAPLLVAAYALLWVAVLGYLWSIWRRMTTVERELADLLRRTGDS